MMFAIMLLPLLTAGGMAIDYARLSNIRDKVQSAADAAVIHGAKERPDDSAYSSEASLAIGSMLPEGMPGWQSSMLDYFNANLDAQVLDAVVGDSDLKVVAHGDGRLSLDVSSDVGLAFSAFLGDTMRVGIRATAWRDTISLPVCFLGLNKTAPSTIAVNGTADITASGCVALSNSNSSESMTQVGSSTITADAICVSGGYTGDNYYPEVREECSQVEDPLFDTFTSDLAPIDTTSCDRYDGTDPMSFYSGTNVIRPGVYCGGIEVRGHERVEMEPGVYIVRDGPFRVQAHGEVYADDVIIILMGESHLEIRAGGDLTLHAPQTGAFAGIAVAQAPGSTDSGENIIIGGGTVNIEGIAYFPDTSLKLTGSGDISMETNQFAVVADTITVEGNGQLNIGASAGHIAAGLPKLPVITSDTIVRLTE